jgi:hypothetical protein
MSDVSVERSQVLRYRWARHQLGAAPAASADVDLLDVGVQDTGPDGSAWALAIRGFDPADHEQLALAWTLRGAPHAYRRRDLAAVAVATAPWSEADAAKRIFDAAKPLKAAGIPVLDALRTVSDALEALAVEPIAKGDASAALNDTLPPPFLRTCRPCQAVHIYEQPFRLAALQAGLELDVRTAPPTLHRVPGLEPNRFAHLADEAEPRLDVVRNLLRFWGPTTAKDVAAFADVPVKEVKARWPHDAVEVTVAGTEDRTASILAEDLDLLLAPPPATGALRLLGPFDPYLQLRDRAVLVPDADRRSALWPVLGRPGAIAVDGELLGLWRPRSKGRRLDLAVEAWTDLAPHHDAIEAEAARLAHHRGKQPGAVTITVEGSGS